MVREWYPIRHFKGEHAGTVDYWCPRSQAYVRNATEVPQDALVYMGTEQADRVRAHLWRYLRKGAA